MSDQYKFTFDATNTSILKMFEVERNKIKLQKTAGSTFDLALNFEPYTSSGGASYTVYSNIVYYGPINKTLDASLEDIIAPTSNENYFSVPQSEFLLKEDEKNMILKMIDESGQKMITTVVKIVDPIFKRYAININQ